ncbi:unnamed protein product [Polarella glacialis]|uniref:Uncharacterized protein n=1 Tax=Polarella glacialis TaxID=89957 RepID=A0A813IXZ0_POLGL|nr:unnamed protein product [Polarella glacialis]
MLRPFFCKPDSIERKRAMAIHTYAKFHSDCNGLGHGLVNNNIKRQHKQQAVYRRCSWLVGVERQAVDNTRYRERGGGGLGEQGVTVTGPVPKLTDAQRTLPNDTGSRVTTTNTNNNNNDNNNNSKSNELQ